MSCPNIKVKFVKMHDARFYCCNKFRSAVNAVGTYPTEWNNCPYCGQRLSLNG